MKTIHEWIKSKQYLPVEISSVRDLLFNDTINRNEMYPNILKRLGGEYSQCAEAIYREVKSLRIC